MSARPSFGLVLLAVAALAGSGCGAQCGDAPNGSPNGAPGVSPAAPPLPPPVQRVEVSDADYHRYQGIFKYREVVRAPAFEVRLSPEKNATVLFVRPDLGSSAHGGFSLATLQDPGQYVELAHDGEGRLVDVVDFDVRDTDGDGRPELLVVANLERQDEQAPPRFRRGYHVEQTEDGKLRTSLASHALRDTSPATVDELVRALDELRHREGCPPLSKDMDELTTVLALRCMVDGDRRAQLAESVQYPLQVVLANGVLVTLTRPAALLEVYDDVVDAGFREALRKGATDRMYWGFKIGRAGPLVDEGKIQAVFNVDPAVQRRMQERLAGDNRWVWRGRPSDDLCRTRQATHVFSYDLASLGDRRFMLMTWNDPKAEMTRTPPDRVLFGVLQYHGTCGNSDYLFAAPEGDVGFHYVACYGPEPTPEYHVTSDAGDEPCLNHRIPK